MSNTLTLELYDTIQCIERNFSLNPNSLDIADSKISFDGLCHTDPRFNSLDYNMMWYGMTHSREEFQRFLYGNDYNDPLIGQIINLIRININTIENIVSRISLISFNREYAS
jgi:hypothetical protein